MLNRFLLALAGLLLTYAAHAANPQVEMKTNQGDMVIELYADKAPKTVENFLEYANSGFYNGTVFHRVIDGFMIQGGGFDTRLNQKPTRAPIRNEADNGLKNTMYTVAMARKMDPHSASAQFFINVADNGFLDHTAPTFDGWGYCVFGKVVKGQDVVDKIARMRTGAAGPFPKDVPLEPVIIKEVKLLKK
ncbi:MAG: peptidylprolyl isomerase [Sulfuricellaceae bacterium]|jgi:cyclophilin family peptidyl-prolyl cis-trans isomerase